MSNKNCVDAQEKFNIHLHKCTLIGYFSLISTHVPGFSVELMMSSVTPSPSGQESSLESATALSCPVSVVACNPERLHSLSVS